MNAFQRLKSLYDVQKALGKLQAALAVFQKGSMHSISISQLFKSKTLWVTVLAFFYHQWPEIKGFLDGNGHGDISSLIDAVAVFAVAVFRMFPTQISEDVLNALKDSTKAAVIVLLALLALSPAVFAGDLPGHFAGAGAGFQNSATPKVSGWATTCIQTVSTLYGCLGTDYSGGTTSTRAEAHQLIKRAGACALFGTAGAGASTSVTGGIGGSFDAGGVAACQIPEKWFKQSGLVAVFSGSWQKNNVLQAADLGTALQRFGSQTVWRFGFGRTW